MSKTNLEKLIDVTGTLSSIYLLLQIFIPIIQNLYAQYGAIVLLALYFLIKWLMK